MAVCCVDLTNQQAHSDKEIPTAPPLGAEKTKTALPARYTIDRVLKKSKNAHPLTKFITNLEGMSRGVTVSKLVKKEYKRKNREDGKVSREM